MTDRPGTGCALAVMLGVVMWAAAFVTAAAVQAEEVGGTASHVGTQYGDRYLALPEGRGVLVEICGNAGCITRRSTDAGPDLAMQRAGRVADLNAYDFSKVCGCPASVGLTEVTVEYLAEIRLPDTSTEGVQ
jgi:hypothetical protein